MICPMLLMKANAAETVNERLDSRAAIAG
jgi:hypothetical protein